MIIKMFLFQHHAPTPRFRKISNGLYDFAQAFPKVALAAGKRSDGLQSVCHLVEKGKSSCRVIRHDLGIVIAVSVGCKYNIFIPFLLQLLLESGDEF